MMLKLTAVLLAVLSVIGAQKHHQQQQHHHQQPQQQQQRQEPVTDPRYKQIPIVNVENVLEVDGKFRYSYEGGDGTRAAQDGQQIVVNNQVGTASQGQYTYQVRADRSRIKERAFRGRVCLTNPRQSVSSFHFPRETTVRRTR